MTFVNEHFPLLLQDATIVLMTFGAGNAIGVILAGFLGHFAYKYDVRGPPILMGVSLLLGCIPFYFLINTIDEQHPNVNALHNMISS